MSLIDNKITAFSKTIAALADKPSLGTTALLKQWFDSSPEELRVAHNNLIDFMAANYKFSSAGINVMDYGASGLATTAVGSITSGTKALTLTTTPDFVAGQGINLQGAIEASSLQVTAAATASSNVTVTLNGVAFPVAVVSGDTAIQVATKIRAATYAGWTAGGTAGTDTVTFTSTTSGVKTDAVYSAGTTTATGTFTTTVQGTADQISTVSSVSGLVVNIADNATRTITAGTILHDDTVAISIAISAAIAAKAILNIPQGTYNVSSLTLNSSLNIKGAGIGKSILQSTNGGNLFLQIAGTASVENVLFQDISIYGGNTDIGGIALGTATYYVAYCVFERVEVKSFSKASAYGLSLNSVQEFHSIDSKYNYSYDNIYRPPTGYVTTCAFSGQAGHIGLAVRYGAYINDTPGGSIRFRDQIFEGNSSNAIYSPTGTKCVVFVKDGYFESNNSSAGTATIDIGGSNADGYSQSSLVLDGCEFHASGNPALPVLKLDRVMWRANNTSGLFNQTITTTANTKGILIGNSIQGDAVNYQTVVGNLLGSHCAIENSVVNGLVIIGNPNFVSGLTVAQMFGTGGNGINMPNLGIGELPNASRQFKVANANPVMQLKVLGGTTDKSKWDIRGVGAAGQESLQINMVNDAETVAVSIARFSSVGNMGLGFTGVTMPNANAILDLSSTTTKAFLPPVMTTTQKNAIASPTAGMVVFDSTLGKLCVYTTAWQTITSA